MKKIQYKINECSVPTKIVEYIERNYQINSSILSNVLNSTNEIYSIGDYKFLSIYVENDSEISIDEYNSIISNKFIHYFNPYIYFLKHIENDLSIKGLKSSKTITDSGNNTIEKVYNNTISSNSTDKGVSENAPITADIDTINTPNFKSKNINDKNSTKTGTDTDTHILSNNIEETNPELFYKYMELYREYNIIDLVDKCYRKIVAEFNSSL